MFNLNGYRGTLTLSAGAYPTQIEANENLLDAILEELPAPHPGDERSIKRSISS